MSSQRLFHGSTEVDSNDRLLFPNARGTMSPASGVAMMLNMIIGTGILRLGSVWRTGAISALVVSTIICFFSWYVLYLFAAVAAETGRSTYEGMWRDVISPRTTWISGFWSVCSKFTLGIAYINFIKSTLASLVLEHFPALEGSFMINTHLISVVVFIVGCMPTIMISTTEGSSMICWIAVGIIAFLGVHTLYWFGRFTLVNGFDPNKELKMAEWDMSLLSCISSLITAYMSIPLTWPAIKHIKGVTRNMLMRVFNISMIVCWVVYAVMGEVSYLTLFESNTGGLIFDYYPKSYFVAMAEVLVIVLMVCSIPMAMNSARYLLIRVVWKKDKIPHLVWVIVGVVWHLIAVAVGELGDPYPRWIGVCVDVAAPLTYFVIPAVLYIATFGKKHMLHMFGAVGMIIVGFGTIALVIYYQC